MIWDIYKNYVRQRIMPGIASDLRDMSYWGDEIFCQMLTYLVPISLAALIPCVLMAFHSDYIFVGVTDLIAFTGLVIIMLRRSLTLGQRKIIFIGIFYLLSVVLIFYVIISGVGMLYLLALTVIIAIIYSIRAAYYSALANTAICLSYALIIHFGGNLSPDKDYTASAWIAISSNLVILSFLCTLCLQLLIGGMEANMLDKIDAKKALKQLNNRLLLATRSAGMGIWEWDVKTNALSWDEAMHKLYETDGRSESVYSAWLSRLHPADKDRTDGDIQNAIMGIKDYDTEFRIIWDDHSIHYIRATGTIVRDDHGEVTCMIGANWDVTASKNTEHRIIELNEGLVAANLQQTVILNTLPANIALLDHQGIIMAVNDGWRHFAEEGNLQHDDHCIGDNYIDICESATGEDAKDAWDMASGIRAILNGTIRNFVMEYPCHTPIAQRWFRVEVSPLDQGRRPGAVVMHINITDRKLAEISLYELNEDLEIKVIERTVELENANRELEAFAYSVSHDLRAPVRAMIGFTKIIRDEYGMTFNADLQDMFFYIEEGSKRMNAIIDDLFTLAKYGKEKMNFSRVDLDILFHEVWDNLLFTSPHQANLEMPKMPVVYADRSMLQQVIVNMLSNSIKYSSKKTTPRVTVGYTQTPESFTVHVQDNGAGFDMNQYDRLFGAFQRLHSSTEFEGTGVGLLITRKIIERHGGTTWAQGKVDEGATFYFSLPVAN